MVKKIDNFYSNNFDLIRLVAALLVLITHCYELMGKISLEPLYHVTNSWIRFSTIGLYGFFFTSGYLVSKSYFNTASLRFFVLKRVLRIYPALIAIVLLSVFFMGPLIADVNIHTYFSNPLTYRYLGTLSGVFINYLLPGVFNSSQHYDHGVNGSLWSIALELKLYICLVLAGKLLKPHSFVKSIMPLIATLIIYITIHSNSQLDNYFDDLHLRLVIIFFIGYTFNFYYDKIPLSWVVLILLFLLYYATLQFLPLLRFIIEPVFFAYATMMAAYRFQVQKLKMDISYGIYIYAFLITQLLIHFFNFSTPVWLTIAVLFTVVPVSILSWLVIEKRFIDLKKKLK